MALKLYYDLMSQPSRGVYMFLKHCKIPFTECPVALRNLEHRSEDFAKINRFQSVPAIEHNGFKLAESIAIVRYISREFPAAEKLYPKNSQGQALVDEFLEWQHLNVRAAAAQYFRTKIIEPVLTGEPVNTKKLEKTAKATEHALTNIEKYFLKNKPFIAGNDVTVADIFAACELEQPYNVGYDVFGGHKILEEWMKRVQNALQPHYDEAHIVVRKFAKKYPTKTKY